MTTDSDDDDRLRLLNDDINNDAERAYGHAATAAEQLAIATLVRQYYEAALAENATKACSMVYASLAREASLTYRHEGPPFLRGAKSCAAVLHRLFAHEHGRFVSKLSHLKVLNVRLRDNHGLALLAFGKLPQREIELQREGSTWKLDDLVDVELV